MFENGMGVAQDYAQASQWYQRAADAGNVSAKRELLRLSPRWVAEAKRYLDAKDYANALPLFQKAAGAGNPDAMDSLGKLQELRTVRVSDRLPDKVSDGLIREVTFEFIPGSDQAA